MGPILEEKTTSYLVWNGGQQASCHHKTPPRSSIGQFPNSPSPRNVRKRRDYASCLSGGIRGGMIQEVMHKFVVHHDPRFSKEVNLNRPLSPEQNSLSCISNLYAAYIKPHRPTKVQASPQAPSSPTVTYTDLHRNSLPGSNSQQSWLSILQLQLCWLC
jgi:hypothetical protein